MALKTFNPVTPSQRQLVLVDRSALYKGKPVKALTEGKSSAGGRNNNGRITVRFRGGGHKQAYRVIDFKRATFDAPATVERLEYDPNRTAFIALVKYQDGELAYILAPQRLGAGDSIVAGENVDARCKQTLHLGIAFWHELDHQGTRESPEILGDTLQRHVVSDRQMVHQSEDQREIGRPAVG